MRAGCTFGKGNLRFLDYGKHVYTFYDRRSGRGVRVATRPDFSTARFDPGFGALRERVQRRHGDAGRARRVPTAAFGPSATRSSRRRPATSSS